MRKKPKLTHFDMFKWNNERFFFNDLIKAIFYIKFLIVSHHISTIKSFYRFTKINNTSAKKYNNINVLPDNRQAFYYYSLA